MMGALLVSIYVFVLAIFVGFEIITKIPPTLHTPLMSGANAISGITLVGSLGAATTGATTAANILGLAIMAGSQKNMQWVTSQMAFQTIGPDKLNQLRHVLFFKNMDGIETHMKKHAAILKPKFEAVQNILDAALAGKKIADWSKPQGGYFVSIDTLEGCADAVVKMAADAGVKLTPAGSTYPLKNDPQDRNIRIAPTFPPLEDIQAAMELVAICIQIGIIVQRIQSISFLPIVR